MADAMEFQRDRDLARDHADDRDGDRVGCDAFPRFVEELVVLALGDIDPARTAANEHTRTRFIEPEAGVMPGFACRDDRNQRRPRVPAGIRAAVTTVPIALYVGVDGRPFV